MYALYLKERRASSERAFKGCAGQGSYITTVLMTKPMFTRRKAELTQSESRKNGQGFTDQEVELNQKPPSPLCISGVSVGWRGACSCNLCVVFESGNAGKMMCFLLYIYLLAFSFFF